MFEGDSEFENDWESPKGSTITNKKQLFNPPKEPRHSTITIQAFQFIQEFEQSRIDLVATVKGHLYTLSLRPPVLDRRTGQLKSKPVVDVKPQLKYFVLDPVHGELIAFQRKEDYLESQVKAAMFIKMK